MEQIKATFSRAPFFAILRLLYHEAKVINNGFICSSSDIIAIDSPG